jgi:hypothetical protein
MPAGFQVLFFYRLAQMAGEKKPPMWKKSRKDRLHVEMHIAPEGQA